MRQGIQVRPLSLLLATLLVIKQLSFSSHMLQLAHTLPERERAHPFSNSSQLRAQDLASP